ncbi:hypothetical protein [Mesorhizobium sp. M00.F.Ca.ET.216.01.1.1]|uniref:hypothetical protein n=1 Tax=Mesorhizobium sp. M00.F.Ca.ET.216.01.1.1 TaxID=2500528 RepID=UPI000FDB8358|nr:hypothetical protein [Mesorhizobium sp. M00.F.Ca.ET.216.01.1.1]TGQ42083.1 hypothetical protein EN859_011925 [Mesorhizobium sp. M00.F.Ca.ET.216.01.1.1]TJW14925.1 MAG: hypothetical protein E5W82_09370 [Mesorhizobium sp.]TJW48635.1 MAG: hypothetical protein E5W83_02205 [Mesorhizobium sp.]
MRSTFFALGLFSVAAIHPALAQQADPGATRGGEPLVAATQGGPNQGPMPWPGPRRPMPHGPEAFDPQRMGPPPELMLAARLSALETRIGARAEQLNAWRDYTSALQVVLTPPRPDHGPDGRPNAGEPGPGVDHTTRDPFAFQERLADDLTKRAASAVKLKDAIVALRAKLTPEQLEILASADQPHGPPAGLPWGNPPDEAAGPGGLPDGRQLPMALPRTDEQL